MTTMPLWSAAVITWFSRFIQAGLSDPSALKALTIQAWSPPGHGGLVLGQPPCNPTVIMRMPCCAYVGSMATSSLVLRCASQVCVSGYRHSAAVAEFSSSKMPCAIRVLSSMPSAGFPGEVSSPLTRKRVPWMASVVCPVPDGAACVACTAGLSVVMQEASSRTPSVPTPRRRVACFTDSLLSSRVSRADHADDDARSPMTGVGRIAAIGFDNHDRYGVAAHHAAGLAHAVGDDQRHVGRQRRRRRGAIARPRHPSGPAGRQRRPGGKALEAARREATAEPIEAGPLAAPEGNARSDCGLVADDED